MIILTSYSKIDKEIPVYQISQLAPEEIKVEQKIKSMVPSWVILSLFRKNRNWPEFKQSFLKEINIEQIKTDVRFLSDAHDSFYLCCHCSSPIFCHRFILNSILKKAGFNCIML